MSDRRGLEGFPMKPNPDKIVPIGTHLTSSLYEDDEIPDREGYAASCLMEDDTLNESHI